MQRRIDTLLKLEEEREKCKRKFEIYQHWIKIWFDKAKAAGEQFLVGDLVLKWEKQNEENGSHKKFQSLWLGPFQIAEKMGHITYRLQSFDGDLDNYPTNGIILKRFFT